MAHVAVVYFSANGHTQQVAHAIADGVRSVLGCTVNMLRIEGQDIKEGRWENAEIVAELAKADAIVFGTPTYMGGIAGQYKAFIDGCSSIWYRQLWKDKLAAGFTHSLGLSGDKLNTLNSLYINAMQHGMVWIGNASMPEGNQPEHANRLGSTSGAMAQSNMDQPTIGEGDRKTAVLFGRRIAESAVRWTK